MSKIPVDRMKSVITEMIKDRKPRKFVETVDLQIGLKVKVSLIVGLRPK